MIRLYAGLTIENISTAHFADRASGVDLAPGERTTLSHDTTDDDCRNLGDVFESVSRAVSCGILKLVRTNT